MKKALPFLMFLLVACSNGSNDPAPTNPTNQPSTTGSNGTSGSTGTGSTSGCGTYNGRALYLGPQGGCYYMNSSGNKQYVDRAYCNC